MINILSVLLILASSVAHADVLVGDVVKIQDGDTITVLDADKNQHKIRLAGIDAPELGQAYGKASRSNLSALIAGKTVQIEWHKRDKYKRIVGKVEWEGTDVCMFQIATGMAWHYVKYQAEQSVQDRSIYAYTQTQAKEKNLGLWQDKEPVPPWEWREKNKNKSDSESIEVASIACDLSPSDELEHGGGLNNCGCHFNRKTGECHCHRARGCGCSCQPVSCK